MGKVGCAAGPQPENVAAVCCEGRMGAFTFLPRHGLMPLQSVVTSSNEAANSSMRTRPIRRSRSLAGRADAGYWFGASQLDHLPRLGHRRQSGLPRSGRWTRSSTSRRPDRAPTPLAFDAARAQRATWQQVGLHVPRPTWPPWATLYAGQRQDHTNAMRQFVEALQGRQRRGAMTRRGIVEAKIADRARPSAALEDYEQAEGQPAPRDSFCARKRKQTCGRRAARTSTPELGERVPGGWASSGSRQATPPRPPSSSSLEQEEYSGAPPT